MTIHEKAMVVFLVICLWGLSTCVRAHDSESREPERMAMQPMKDLKGWSKLCTAPVQYLLEDGTWGDPVLKCVFIETPDFSDPGKYLVCDAVSPGLDYISCGTVL